MIMVNSVTAAICVYGTSTSCMIKNRGFKNREAIPVTPCQRIAGTL